jgi:hypothetical protein
VRRCSRLQVERYLVVHGQIVLNQFKNYPVKAVRECAFVGALRDRMRARRHSKLFLSKRKITVAMRAGRKVNPMRDRSPKSKPKPMTATATSLVKAIWEDYFNAGVEDKSALLAAPRCALCLHERSRSSALQRWQHMRGLMPKRWSELEHADTVLLCRQGWRAGQPGGGGRKRGGGW